MARHDEVARRAIRALLQGETMQGVNARTCGQWWYLVETVQQVAADHGLEMVRAFIKNLAGQSPRLHLLLADLVVEAPAPAVDATTLLEGWATGLRWTVPGIVPEGLTILAGAPKLGKSWLCLDLALAVSRGEQALGNVEVERGDVLYLALEDTQRRLRGRLLRLLDNKPLPEGLEFVTLDHNFPRLDQGGKLFLNKWLDEHPRARLIIVDTLAKFKPQSAGGAGSYERDYSGMHGLLTLAGKHRIAIVVVHHTRKAAADDALEAISGSFGLSGGVDGVLVLRRERGRAEAVLHVTGRDVEEQVLALGWDATATRWIVLGQADEVWRTRVRDAVLRVLRAEQRPMKPKEVFEALEAELPRVTYNTVRQRMYQMSKSGVLSTSNGHYELAPGPDEQPRQTTDTSA